MAPALVASQSSSPYLLSLQAASSPAFTAPWPPTSVSCMSHGYGMKMATAVAAWMGRASEAQIHGGCWKMAAGRKSCSGMTGRLGIAAAKAAQDGGEYGRWMGTEEGMNAEQGEAKPEEEMEGESRRKMGREEGTGRRGVVLAVAASMGLVVLGVGGGEGEAEAEEGAVTSRSQYTDMPALRGKDYGKSKMKYPDYIETPSGLQYKDLRDGSGSVPKTGDTVVVDWDGFTIGYYGRIFEARNKAKGGSFEGNEKDFFRFKLGMNEVIPAFEEAVASMQVGGIRRIIVPPELGYPDNDFNKKGPRPITFSGQRALDFVLRNQGLIDKTLLFDIELLRVIEG